MFDNLWPYEPTHIGFLKFSRSLITQDFKEDLHKYISGIVRKQNQKLISINGMSDHLHILIGLRPAKALADRMFIATLG